MTTLTWIYIGGAAVEALIVTIGFFGLRSYRSKFRRQHLMPCIGSGMPWVVVALIFFDPLFTTLLLASVVGIYAPAIYWILKSPSDDPVACMGLAGPQFRAACLSGYGSIIICIAVALILGGAFLYGCSSSPIQNSAKTIDLGVIELANNATRHFSLTGNRDCRLTLTVLANGRVLVEAVVLEKDTQGNLKVLGRPRKEASFGKKASLQIGNESITLTAKRI